MKDRLVELCKRLDALEEDTNQGLWERGPKLIAALQDVRGWGAWSLRHVARISGYSPATLSQINSGKLRMSRAMYVKLARLLERLQKNQAVEDK